MNGADHQAANSQPKQARKYLVKVLACSTWSCTPSRRAALRCSLESASASSGLVGLTSRAKVAGEHFVQQLQPLALPSRSSRYTSDAVAWSVQARDKPKLAGSSPDLASATQHATNSPVALPPGRLRLVTSPAWTEAYLRVRSNPWPGVTDAVRAENKTSSRL